MFLEKAADYLEAPSYGKTFCFTSVCSFPNRQETTKSTFLLFSGKQMKHENYL